MPELRTLGPILPLTELEEEDYFKKCVEEVREFLTQKLNEAYSIPNTTFQTICMFAVIDCLAQEYANYPPIKAKETFCSFVLQFQNKYDFLELVEPVTLFYDYEPKIRKTIKYSGLYEFDSKLFHHELEVSIEDLKITLEPTPIVEIIQSQKAEEILSIIESQDGEKAKKVYMEKHRFISLLYKMRSKAVHELSSLGGEHKWEIENNNQLPYYREVSRMYVEDKSIVSDDVYELVIPNGFIYDLTLNCIENYLDYCINQKRQPFENNINFKRKVDIAWVD